MIVDAAAVLKTAVANEILFQNVFRKDNSS